MTQELANLAINMNLPALFCEQLEAGERITMWAEELQLVRPRVWGVYQDTPGRFSLQVKFQGYTGSEADGFPLIPLPEDIASAKAAGDPNYWELGGYVALHEEDLEPELIAALNVLLEWTKEAAAILKSGGKPNYKETPNLWFEPSDGEAGIQLLPKVNKEGQLSFSGWAFRGLEWHGDGLKGRKVEFNDYFFNGRPNPSGAKVDKPIKPIKRTLTPPQEPKEPVGATRGRGRNQPEIPNLPKTPSDDCP